MTPVILALDPAKSKSGAALMLDERTFVLGGLARKQSVREYFVREASSLAAALGRPLVCVAEEWDPPRHKRKRTADGEERVEFDQRWTFKTIMGMGAGWGLWEAELERYRVKHIVRVTPNTWRDALFGKRRAKDTKSAKRQAVLHALALFGEEMPDDVAEAVCIGLWGFKASSVLQCANGLPDKKAGAGVVLVPPRSTISQPRRRGLRPPAP